MKLAFVIAATAALVMGLQSVPARDQAFAKNVAQGGLAEIQFGQLALTKGSSQKVKDFAQKMVDDNTRIADSLRALAGEKDIMLPTDLQRGDLAVANQLTGLSGDAFDKAYMGAMVRDHRTEIAVFQAEANSGSDKDLQGFASKELPTLRQHLQMAEITAASVGAEATSVPDL